MQLNIEYGINKRTVVEMCVCDKNVFMFHLIVKLANRDDASHLAAGNYRIHLSNVNRIVN